MLKEQFLNDKCVSGFIRWFRDKLPDFPYSYYNYKKKKEWNCTSFYDARDKYEWNGHNWDDNKIELERLSKQLKESIENKDNKACQEACLAILKWGGGLRKNKEKIAAFDNLPQYLEEAKQILTKDSLGDIVPEKIIMNSGFSKIYSLYIDDFAIYDSRVGAALCYLVKRYCKEQGLNSVPAFLKFAYGNSMNLKVNRNPNDDTYQFYLLGRDKIHIECNVKANWLFKEVLNFSTCRFHDIRSLEASLFMIGYEIRRNNMD